MNLKFCLLWVSITLWAVFRLGKTTTPVVTGVTPQCGSINGGTKITVTGKNFSPNYFNFGVGNDGLGSKVSLASLTSYSCDLHPDGSTETQVTCYTQPMPADTYNVKVSVDSVDVPDDKYCTEATSCQFKTSKECTPTIDTLKPVSGLPGEFIELTGNIITDKYGANEPDESKAMILRVYFGGQKCEIRDIQNDTLYGLSIVGSTGYMKCKTEGTYIGNHDVSFLVSNQYGRSMPNSALKLIHRNGIGMFQTFTEISGLSLNEGSTEGGTLLTVYGQYFDETDAKAKIFVGDKECLVQDPISDTEIKCLTPKTAEGTSHFSGNRGFYVYMKNGTTNASTIDRNTATVQLIDQSSWSAVNWGAHAIQMVGYFVPINTGNYTFCLNSANTATLFMSTGMNPKDKIQVFTESSCTSESKPYYLQADQKYYTEIYYGSSLPNSYVTLVAHSLQTNYTAEDTGLAKHEVQKIAFSSTQANEVQKIDLEVTSNGSQVVKDVQSLVFSNIPDASVSFGQDGVFTIPLKISTLSSSLIQSELSNLPNNYFSVNVILEKNATNIKATFTLDSKQGYLYSGTASTFVAKIIGTNINATFTAVRIELGQPTLTSYSLTMNGLPTRPIQIKAPASEVQTAIEELFSVRCHSLLSSGTYLQSFEQSYYSSMVEPFCGRYSVQNPNYIYSKDSTTGLSVSTSSNKFMCLAHRGQGKLKNIRVYFAYKDSSFKDATASAIFSVPSSNPDQWNYWCGDVLGLFNSIAIGTAIRIEYIQISRVDTTEDLFIDHLLFNKVSVLDVVDVDFIYLLRMPQVQPNSAFIKTVKVTGSFPSYSITLTPHNCGYNFPLFGVAAADQLESSYTLTNGGSVKITVSQISAASPPIGGNYTVTLKGETSPDPVQVSSTISAKPLIGAFSSMSVGYTDVQATGTCSAFDLIVTMLSLPGDQPLLQVDSTYLTGNKVSVSVQTVTDGGVWMNPIMGDLLRTYHQTPQVIAFINNVPTRCQTSTSCTFAWSTTKTPNVTGIAPVNGSAGVGVTIFGIGFNDTSISSNKVNIGNTPCEITSVANTSIQCTLGNGVTGAADIFVTVDGLGLATSSVQFTYITDVTHFSPDSGSVEGGTILTITGFGFTPDVNITLDGNQCTVETLTQSEITCRTPRATSFTTNASANIQVAQSGSLKQVGNFSYKLSDTPVVQSISTTNSSVMGGQAINITGENFGAANVTVKLGNVALNVTQQSDTNLIALLPPLPDGTYRLIVYVPNKGYADLRKNSIADIEYMLRINSLSPDFGSLYGGTDLVITGSGFSLNKTQMSVTIGSHTCDIKNLTDSTIGCRIQDTGRHHTVSATGIHKSLGYGYAWSKDPITIEVGDFITWTWETPQYVSDIAYSVQQTATPFDLKSLPGGFSSGNKKRIGSFTYRFTTAGTFYYWTNYMDSENSIFFRGTVNVVEPMSYLGILSVKLLGIEAKHIKGSLLEENSTLSMCNYGSAITECEDKNPLAVSNNSFSFKFLRCFSPVVNTISLGQGTFSDVITFKGSGFGTEDCQNEVMYANSQCTVVSSSENELNFTVSAEGEPPIGELLEFKMRVANLGYGIVAIPNDKDRRFGLLPRILDIFPKEGSNVGGTLLTITGEGFVNVDSIVVELSAMSCKMKSVSYTEAICETYCGSTCGPQNQTVTLIVDVMGNTIPALCPLSNCLFQTLDSLTAVVTNIYPVEVSTGSTNLTIFGTGFSTTADQLKVKLGDQDCSDVVVFNSSAFTCTISRLPVGSNDIKVYVDNNGLAFTTLKLKSKAVANITSPAESGIHGGAQLVIDGNGFTKDTVVQVGNSPCTNVTATLSQVTCTLPAHSAGMVKVYIVSNKINYDELTLVYSLSSTPTITTVSPSTGQASAIITIAGSGFTSTPIVKIGDVLCSNVTKMNEASLTCTTGVQNTGVFSVQLFVEQKGFSNKDINFTYQLSPFTVSPTEGSTNGGQLLTLTGSGFLENKTSVTICGALCQEVSATTSEYVCRTPAGTSGSCVVIATVEGVTVTSLSNYSYNSTLDSTVTSVNPSRGGTGGGTVLTITGTNFGSTAGEIVVNILGATCNVTSVNDTQILCTTGAAKSGNALIEVQRNNRGLAKKVNASFQYIDLWSSRYTWGGNSPPTDGDFVVIPPNQIILLDNDTAVLKMILIQGGQLIFDEKNVELKAENILITNGGLLQVGSAERPFPKEYKAIITLYGHLRSKELPVYGTKTLAVREGTLNLYGSPITVVWTRLSSTSSAGSKILQLDHEVDWQPGDEIVIATTGDKFSQKETEVRIIESVQGRTVNLTKALDYEHLGLVAQFGDRNVEFKAEVGLLTRNIVVRGYRNVEFDTTIPACAAGFDPGEFAVQTCFQGRFGEELGSDQFGGQIMIHQMGKDTQIAQAHIQYVEVTFAGQAFRLGRYAIHFHRNGNMDKSFIRGCSIHKSFNRAVNIHGSHNSLVENNVVFDIMGGALFLEDGDEVGNIFQYNLVLFVRASSSLRNDDITPAGFWATNPNNTIRHNNVAGGTHFGVWYRMHVHPDGPGYDVNICPQATPLGEYKNNTAHSLGWFGLWIFETYIPMAGASCSSSSHQVAKFYTLTAWSCDKGAEGVNIGAVQFRNFTLVNNLNAGFESKLVVQTPPQYDANNGPGIFDSLIVSYYPGLRGDSTISGIVLPYQTGFLVKGVTFYNFNQSEHSTFSWTRIAGVCTHFCGGFTTESEGLSFVNSPNKVKYEWESEGVIYDRDGSLAGNANYSVVPCTPSLDNTKCTNNQEMSVKVNGCICTNDIKLVRFSFNNIAPTDMQGKNAIFVSKFGSSSSPFAPKRITHPNGWSFVLMVNNDYNLYFENAPRVSNMSYTGIFYRFDVGDAVLLKQYAETEPDKVLLNEVAAPKSLTMLNGSNVINGQWFYNDTDHTITYAVKRQASKKRAIFKTVKEREVNLKVIRCFYRGCQPPSDPMDILVRPSNAEYWSKNSTWQSITADGSEPKELSDLTIPKNKWIIVDKPIPKLGKLMLEGGLEFLEDDTRDVTLDVEYIHITGRLVAGWNSSAPLLGKLLIRLRGDITSVPFNSSSGPFLGTRFIGVFGGLQLHGKDRGVTKTYLASTVDSGESINVIDSVSWGPGDIILITTTDYNPWHAETFTITSVNGTQIFLNDTIKYRHIAYMKTVKSNTINLSAVVALLTRNIRIEGEDYDSLINDSHGARVIISQTDYKGSQYSGFAQISNVEFYHSGQEGYNVNYDPRYSVAYVDVINTPGQLRYSYVKKSSFYCGFNTAIGAFGINNLEIDNNIIYQTVNSGIRTESSGTQITNNMVALTLWPGTYHGRKDSANKDFEGAIEAVLASNLVLKNNTVSGVERAGYHLKGQLCNTTSDKLWSGNVAVAGLVGVLVLPDDVTVSSDCTMFNGFTLWKNFDFGIYHNNIANGIFKQNIFIENGIGLFPMVIGPNEVTHVYMDKYVEVNNNIFIGKTSTFCDVLDQLDAADTLLFYSDNVRGHGVKPCGLIGVEITTFTGGSNAAPGKPFVHIMSYPTMKGITKLNNNVFVDFNSCTNGRDYAVVTNKDNDDGNLPLIIQKSELINVNHSSKIYFNIPNLSKINPADCVDMDCDGLKKCMIQDLDGTFLGHVGTALPNSAFEWDADPRRGLGDYRIPSIMLASRNGKKIDVKSYAPHKGIYKTDNCTWIPEWNAFECGDNYQWRILTIESMDDDTETRRLSPVAIYNPEGYIDLINGPQDHGWCSGYTCQRRVSTFQAIVALDNPFEIYLSSNNPSVMRFILSSSDSNECFRLSLQLMTANRPEVRVNNSLIMPNNGFMDSKGRFRLKLQETTGQFMPDVLNKTEGSNYYSREENKLFWIMCGNSEVTVTQTEALIVSLTLGAMSEDEFFGEKLIENLCAFLNMDPRKVRIVNIVRDTSSTGRRKRAVSIITVIIEISDPPGETTTNTSTIDFKNITQQISVQIQTQGLDSVLNVTVISTSMQQPGTPSNSTVSILKPAKLVMDTAPVGGVLEKMALKVQPKFKVVDSYGSVVEGLGYLSTPWVITASIKFPTNSQDLLQHGTIQFVNGWANFTDLTIIWRGTYILEFTVTSPSDAVGYYITADSIKITGHDYNVRAELIGDASLTNKSIQIDVSLIDKDTNQQQSDLNWRFLNWTASVELADSSVYTGVLKGNLTVPFNQSTGYASFSDIMLDKPGVCKLLVKVQSDPPLYTIDLSPNLSLILMSLEQKNLKVEKNHIIEFKFDILYNLYNAELLATKIANLYSETAGIRIDSVSSRQGSIIVSLTIAATSVGYNQMIESMCTRVVNSQQITIAGNSYTLSQYLTQDGQPYVNGSCETLKEKQSSTTESPDTPPESLDRLETKYIIIIVVLSVLLVVVVFILIFKLCNQAKIKTHAFNNTEENTYEYSLMTKDSSIFSRPLTPSIPPVNHTEQPQLHME